MLGYHRAGSSAGAPAFSVKYEHPLERDFETFALYLLRQAACERAFERAAAGEEQPAPPLMSAMTNADIGMLPFAYGRSKETSRPLSLNECTAFEAVYAAVAAAHESPASAECAAAVTAAGDQLAAAQQKAGARVQVARAQEQQEKEQETAARCAEREARQAAQAGTGEGGAGAAAEGGAGR